MAINAPDVSYYYFFGWAVITCSCGVVYSVKFNLRADFVDLLRLLDPDTENVKQASEGEVYVNMPWLKPPKMPADKDGHPLTGSSQLFFERCVPPGQQRRPEGGSE